MDEPIEDLAQDAAPATSPKTNRGWFKPADRRINLEGRPRGSKVATPDGTPPVDCAKRADRVKLMFVRGVALAFRLGHGDAPWASNLPPECEIVDCRFDAKRKGVVLTVRSATFPRIARGAPIPEFVPHYNGLKFGRHWEPEGKYKLRPVGGGFAMQRVDDEQSTA